MSEFNLISPVNGQTYATLSHTSDTDAERALVKARAAQADWARTPLETRMKLCRGFVDIMLSNQSDMAEELTWQMGRPILFTPKEITTLADRANTMIDTAQRGLAPLNISVGRRIERLPHGVALIVAPWNYPFLTAVNTIVPALLSGNAVILKPAGQTALTGDRFALAFSQAGLPDGLFASLLLTHETVGRWLKHREVNFVSFTGSVRGGKQIEEGAAGRFLPISLELGGKDPAYVRADANLDFAARELVDGSFFNSGQSCCGIERIYVDRAVFDPFVEHFVEITRNTQKLGDPTLSNTTLGPLVSSKAAVEIRKQVADAVAAGARIMTGDQGNDAANPYLEATVLVDVDHSMEVMTEETFGPVVGIMAVDGDEQAIRMMNDSRYGLSASVWSSDAEKAEALGNDIQTGTFFVNRCDYLDPGLAWVGIKDSGRGCSLSQLGFHHLTRPKSFHIKTL